MDRKSFDQLLSSVREGGEILRGEKPPARKFTINSDGVKAIRERTTLSQGDFANFIGVSVKTLQNWEQNRRKPTGPAEALLRLIAAQPLLARKPVAGPAPAKPGKKGLTLGAMKGKMEIIGDIVSPTGAFDRWKRNIK